MKRATVLLLAASGCATLGSLGGGDSNLPTSGVGPFRKLASTEVLGVAPYVLDDANALYREPSAIAADPSDTARAGVLLYAVASQTMGTGTRDVLVRTRADDARSFHGTGLDLGHHPAVVLAADAPWEGTSLAGPSVLRVGARFFLYYAAAGGIGLAESDDGLTFTKQPSPVLTQDATVAWETTPPSAPSVAIFPDGRLHMLYAAGVAIGEATSADGVAWQRLDADNTTPAVDPVLVPSAPVVVPDGGTGPIDTGQVTDPCLLPRVSAAGRLQVRVLYTGYDNAPGSMKRNSAIGFAARYGGAGGLVRQPLPVFSVGKHEAAPTLFEWDQGSMLYVHLDDTSMGPPFPAIGAAFAPPELTLSKPTAYSAAP